MVSVAKAGNLFKSYGSSVMAYWRSGLWSLDQLNKIIGLPFLLQVLTAVCINGSVVLQPIEAAQCLGNFKLVYQQIYFNVVLGAVFSNGNICSSIFRVPAHHLL